MSACLSLGGRFCMHGRPFREAAPHLHSASRHQVGCFKFTLQSTTRSALAPPGSVLAGPRAAHSCCQRRCSSCCLHSALPRRVLACGLPPWRKSGHCQANRMLNPMAMQAIDTHGLSRSPAVRGQGAFGCLWAKHGMPAGAAFETCPQAHPCRQVPLAWAIQHPLAPSAIPIRAAFQNSPLNLRK